MCSKVRLCIIAQSYSQRSIKEVHCELQSSSLSGAFLHHFLLDQDLPTCLTMSLDLLNYEKIRSQWSIFSLELVSSAWKWEAGHSSRSLLFIGMVSDVMLAIIQYLGYVHLNTIQNTNPSLCAHFTAGVCRFLMLHLRATKVNIQSHRTRSTRFSKFLEPGLITICSVLHWASSIKAQIPKRDRT